MTDHSHIVTEMRTQASDPLCFPQNVPTGEEFRALPKSNQISLTNMETRRLALVAAADLLEIHDATGLNLHEAPGLLAFVTDQVQNVARFYGVEVENNHA